MILVFTQKVSNCLHYVLKEIFVNRFHQQFEITQDQNHYLQASSDIKIYYTEYQISDFEGHWVPNSNFLFTENFQNLNIKKDLPTGIIQFPKNKTIDKTYDNICNILSIQNDLTTESESFSKRRVYFPIDSHLGFDIFAHVFALIANVEECLLRSETMDSDKNGRFDTKNLNFVKQNMHLLPMADLAIERLREFIGLSPSKENNFCIIPTADIDQCFQFKGKSLKKFVGGGIKHPVTLWDRFEYLFTRKDHFAPSNDLFKYLEIQEKSRLFWLCNLKETEKNKQISRENTDLTLEIEQSKYHAHIGLHPSYQNFDQQKIYQEEKDWLEKTAKTNITHSRQHYLHFELPKTYIELESIGITDDWSMGFANTVGYRNGSSLPVTWFNIFDQKERNFTIHSFSIMDVTCKNYLKLNSFYSLQLGTLFKQIIQEINGQFTFIIHNESFSEKDGWRGWKKTFNSWASNI